jgi:hypothetical protein
MIEMTRKPALQSLRWFGVIMLVFFSAVAAVAYFKLRVPGVAYGLVGAGALLCLLYYAVRPLRVPMYSAWMRIFFPVGWIVSHTIVAVIYYLLVTPIGLMTRLFGYDPMARRLDRRARSYWVPLRRDGDISKYFRQY